ncbi:MAG: hypothetical protein Q9195_007426 [Heterodermia aff. obscurata]
MQPGSELMAVEKLYAGKPFSYSEEWFKYVVYNPSWNPSSFNPDQDAAAAEALNPSNIRTWPCHLSAYRDKGGKLLLYHGGQDNQITSFNTERFYHHLLSSSQQDDNLDTFFRFFRVPGMFHCNSGPGAWVMGQGGGASAQGVPFRAPNNVLAALVRWVENGTAVDEIVGTKFVDDSVERGIAFQHRHCRYPSRSTFRGGDAAALGSWECV